MFKFLRALARDQNGATAIEYGLIAALISVAAIVALSAVGDSLISIFSKISTVIASATIS